MKDKDLTLAYWLFNGWQVYRKNLKRVLTVTLVLFIYLWLLVPIGRLPYGWLIANIISLIVGPALGGGYSLYCLMLLREGNAKLKDLLAGFANFWQVLLVNFLFWAIVTVGLLLLIVPGIVWFVKYGFNLIVVLDKKLSPLQAVKFSGNITYGHKGRLLVLIALTFGVAISFVVLMSLLRGRPYLPQQHPMKVIFLVVIPSLFYHFVILPLSFLAYVAAYDSLSKHYEQVNQINIESE